MPGSPAADAEPDRFEPEQLPGLPVELALSRLPSGRHGLPRSFVARNQRLRIIAAMLRVLPQRGYTAMTIGDLIKEAGVSRAAFYGQFETKEECFLATYDIAAQWVCDRVERVASNVHRWPESAHAGVEEAMQLLAANPDVANLIAVEALQAGGAARRRRQVCIERLAEILRAGRPPDAELPEELEELLIGGTLSLIGRYVDTGRVDRLPDATVDLMALYFLK
jgi:AcrR family transcriptional regulator